MRQDWNLYGFLGKFPAVSWEQALAEVEGAARQTARECIQSARDGGIGGLAFVGSGAPVREMFGYLADGRSLKDFHWDFPAAAPPVAADTLTAAGWLLELDAYRGVENGLVHSDRGTLSGAPVFVGSRMPIRLVFDCLLEGQTLKDFCFAYDTGVKAQLAPLLHLAYQILEREFYAAAPR